MCSFVSFAGCYKYQRTQGQLAPDSWRCQTLHIVVQRLPITSSHLSMTWTSINAAQILSRSFSIIRSYWLHLRHLQWQDQLFKQEHSGENRSRHLSSRTPSLLGWCGEYTPLIQPCPLPVRGKGQGCADILFFGVYTPSEADGAADMRACKAFAPHKLQAFPFSGAGAILPRYW